MIKKKNFFDLWKIHNNNNSLLLNVYKDKSSVDLHQTNTIINIFKHLTQLQKE